MNYRQILSNGYLTPTGSDFLVSLSESILYDLPEWYIFRWVDHSADTAKLQCFEEETVHFGDGFICYLKICIHLFQVALSASCLRNPRKPLTLIRGVLRSWDTV